MAGYANPSTYEQQNEDSLNRLFNKVHSLVRAQKRRLTQREVTINIHNDADQQRSLIDETVCCYDRASNMTVLVI